MDASPRPQCAATDIPSRTDPPWQDIREQAERLATSLRTLAEGQAPGVLSACLAYAQLVDEIVRLAAAPDAEAPAFRRLARTTTPKQLQEFGRLLRDKRNQAGLSRVQLARKAKVSDVTIKFLETARHPPSRATLLRLVGVPELGLRWSETPGGLQAPPGLETEASALSAAELHRFDARLSLPMVLEVLLVLDELRTSLSRVEITAYGARRACSVCGMRSESWAVDAREAAKLPIRHGVPCAGQLAESLGQRYPALADLAHQERRSLRSRAAAEIEARRQAAPIERFYGCRSGREVATHLARVAALPPTPYRAGVRAVLLWAMALGPCPVEPAADAFTERRTRQLAEGVYGSSVLETQNPLQLRGASDAASWLLSAAEPSPAEPVPDTPDLRLDPDESPHAPI